jgi:hypothetical protein
MEVVLYRPVGRRELELFEAFGVRGFPPRLPHQPIFYPVLSEEYAVKIARDWNTKDPNSGFAGYVTRFTLEAEYAARFEPHDVGGSSHQEHWVPAQELEVFNTHIVGPIEVIGRFEGAPAAGP